MYNKHTVMIIMHVAIFKTKVICNTVLTIIIICDKLLMVVTIHYVLKVMKRMMNYTIPLIIFIMHNKSNNTLKSNPHKECCIFLFVSLYCLDLQRTWKNFNNSSIHLK